jgi:proteasome maturation protein
MELKIVRTADSFRPSVLGRSSGVHEEILTGRDSSVEWEDVYAGQDGLAVGGVEAVGGANWTEEMERKIGVGKW